jgi:hypothetical protein
MQKAGTFGVIKLLIAADFPNEFELNYGVKFIFSFVAKGFWETFDT